MVLAWCVALMCLFVAVAGAIALYVACFVMAKPCYPPPQKRAFRPAWRNPLSSTHRPRGCRPPPQTP